MNTTLEIAELDRKIGRLFMFGMPGTGLDDDTRDLIRSIHPGGVILFSRNVESPSQLAELCRALQATSFEFHGTPLFLAVDQEGGRVARLKAPFTEFPGSQVIGGDENPDVRAEAFALTTAREMRMVGLNMDLAPVLDVGREDLEEHLRGRTFGNDPAFVARLGGIVIRTLQAEGVMAVAKHFPGLGRTATDPHHHLPEISLEPSELEQVNLVPFRAAVQEGVAGIMTSHAVYSCLDAHVPATMSRAVLDGLLRRDMGYEGLVITDDLEMGAIAAGWGVPQGAAAAFDAGADILLICEHQALVEESLREIRGRLLRGTIPMGRLHRSIRRIDHAMTRFLTRRHAGSPEEVASYFSRKA